ncbi:MAG: hemerythrin family protein [Alphaproteobacteria bacterium]|nr:hemerythrin family protein [Alphaproteobacteria bacterium]
MPFTWKEEYATGITPVDMEHKILFSITGLLADAIRDGTDQQAIQDFISQLIDYIERHFAREEEIFRASDYPDFEAHAKLHRDIERTMRNIANRYETDPSAVSSKELLRFLEVWLSQHIMGTDMKYVPFVMESDAALAAAK